MGAPCRWLVPQADPGAAAALATRLGISAPAARVLVRRGYADPETAQRFLHPRLEDLHDPFLLPGMREAVQRLRRAVSSRERILLYGDYDADGTTSVVILKKAIQLAGGEAVFHVPHRLRDGYGMRPDIVERAAAEGIRLIISVDTGIRAAETVRHARGLDIDVIITDHHLPERELPPALAVLNPSLPGSTYPDRHLCGAGVALKLAQALFTTLDWGPERVRSMTESFLKIAAIGTVADVVPLVGENRIIVKHGLEGLRRVRNLGLRALLDAAGFAAGDRPSAGQVAFRIAPRMNAAGRMASAAEVIELFLTEDQDRAREVAQHLNMLNQERQQAENEILKSILEECARTPVTGSQAALVFAGEGWHRGVVGIVASRLVDRFHRPVIVLSTDSEEGLAEGSGRSIPSFHLLEALEAHSDILLRFGGHRQATGLTLPLDRVEEFRQRLNAYAAARLTPSDFELLLEVDAPLALAEIDDDSVNEMLCMAPFGPGNPAPLFVLHDVEVAQEPVLWKENHLRLLLRQGERTLGVKAWNFADRLAELEAGARLDVVVCFEEDPYAQSRGYPGWAALLRAARRVT